MPLISKIFPSDFIRRFRRVWPCRSTISNTRFSEAKITSIRSYYCLREPSIRHVLYFKWLKKTPVHKGATSRLFGIQQYKWSSIKPSLIVKHLTTSIFFSSQLNLSHTGNWKTSCRYGLKAKKRNGKTGEHWYLYSCLSLKKPDFPSHHLTALAERLIYVRGYPSSISIQPFLPFVIQSLSAHINLKSSMKVTNRLMKANLWVRSLFSVDTSRFWQ